MQLQICFMQYVYVMAFQYFTKVAILYYISDMLMSVFILWSNIVVAFVVNNGLLRLLFNGIAANLHKVAAVPYGL